MCACDAMSHVACVLLDVERVNVKGRIRCNEEAAGDRVSRGWATVVGYNLAKLCSAVKLTVCWGVRESTVMLSCLFLGRQAGVPVHVILLFFRDCTGPGTGTGTSRTTGTGTGTEPTGTGTGPATELIGSGASGAMETHAKVGGVASVV